MAATKKAPSPKPHARKPAAVAPASAPVKRSKALALAGISEKILLSQEHAAALIDISVRTLQTMLLRGEIQGLRVGGRHMVPRTSLDAWLARQISEQLGEAQSA